jgi:adenine-specific DNA-methyltransferase
MTTKTVEQVTKATPDITREQIERLKQIFPECVTEGKVDFDRLRATLGEADALAGDDGAGGAYTFTWAGKQEAFRAIQTPSGASLAPLPAESVNWDETRHLFIEGENLEVLKLIYKSYFGKVKMIYIDPPYNTGNDFIYRDDYSEPRRAYLEKTGQMDAEGNVLTSNPETSGRYHSDWLTMMYPRLFVARQLLREDGVIFVSIDDNEVHHMRLMMNEIFGEENFIANIVWQKKQSPQSDAIYLSDMHDHILVYAKRAKTSRHDPAGWQRQLLPRTEEHNARYSNPDDDPRGPWASVDYTCNKTAEERPNLYYPITNPHTGQEVWPSKQRVWYASRDVHKQNVRENRIWWGSDGTNFPRLKKFLSEVQSGIVPSTWWDRSFAGDNQQARREIRGCFTEEEVFDTPKPVTLLRRILQISTELGEEAIILDFFAGSATTAEAVLRLNCEDEGHRRFIMVQLPEPAESSSYSTIADVGKERIRRVIARMQEGDEDGQLSLDLQSDQDLGFKVFKLTSSTFREWEPPESEEDEVLGEQLSLFDRGLKEDADPCHVIYEVILKLGYSLNAQIEPLELEGNRVYKVTGDRTFYICLDDELETATLDALPLDKLTTFVCLDTALDDSQKVNLAMGSMLKVI